MVKGAGLIFSNTKVTLLIGLLAVLLASGIILANKFSANVTKSSSDQSVTIPVKYPINSSAEPSSSDEGFVDNGSTTNSSNTSVIVNGQSIDVPQNGNVNQTITNDGSTTTHVEVQNSSSQSLSGTSNHSTLNVNVNSHSSSQEASP